MFKAICLASLTSATLLLTGCASFNQLNSEVSSFGAWPAQRQAASYVFERLPSQAAHPEQPQQLEDAARGALGAAGFRPAADVAQAEYLVQLAARVSSNDPWFTNDAFPWRTHSRFNAGWGYSRWGRSPWGLGLGYGYESMASFEREVAVLIRDRRTGALLYEARASNSGPSAGIVALLPAMFRAALQGFPAAGPNPRNVTVQISSN